VSANVGRGRCEEAVDPTPKGNWVPPLSKKGRETFLLSSSLRGGGQGICHEQETSALRLRGESTPPILVNAFLLGEIRGGGTSRENLAAGEDLSLATRVLPDLRKKGASPLQGIKS